MDTIQKLTELFKHFPGIGPRQAKRFVYFLLTQNQGYTTEIARLVGELKQDIACCDMCYRFFPKAGAQTSLCPICATTSRDQTSLLIVSRDVDFENIERTKSFNGYYFILGGVLPILEENPQHVIRQRELLDVLVKRHQSGLKEVILALDCNPEGENTSDHIQRLLGPLAIQYGFRVSTLGRGLSTGAELEYSDPDTLRSALYNRK